MSNSLFPLPLTLWEELFVVDDYENYPANFMTRVRCNGAISRELFEQALVNCTLSHPLFDCHVQRKGRRYYWEPDPQKEMPLRFESSDREPAFPKMSKIDVFEGRLWQVVVVEWKDNGADKMDIFVELHHTLCDGLGAIQFIGDVAKEIHDLHRKAELEKEDGSQVLKPLRNAETEVQALKSRGRFKQSWSEFFKCLPYQYKSVLASLRLIFTRVAPLVPVESVRDLMDQPKTRLGYEKIVLSVADSSRLRRDCRKKNTTVNSRVAAELFTTIAKWKQDQGHPVPKSLRIMIPFNERNLNDSRLPACNRVSLSPFTRSRKEYSDPQKLLASVENGVRLIKKAKLGFNFHRGLWFCRNILGNLKILAKTNRVGTTGVFANVGNLQAHLGLPVEQNEIQCGPFTIWDIDLVPTIRIGTSFAMTMHEFNGETRLGIHYDSALLTAEQMASFAAFLKQRIVDIPSS